jgi:tetrahydromethanopterin S-methyltransferase subunit H
LNLWQTSAEAMLRNKERYSDRVCILTFEDLVGKTESIVRYLAKFLEIEFDDILLIPTFNKFPIKANTSFKARRHGIINGTLNRYKSLSKEELDIIDHMTKGLYHQVLSRAVRF